MRQFQAIRRQIASQGLNPHEAHVVRKGRLVPKSIHKSDDIKSEVESNLESSTNDNIVLDDTVNNENQTVEEVAVSIEATETLVEDKIASPDTSLPAEDAKTKKKSPPKKKKTDVTL